MQTLRKGLVPAVQIVPAVPSLLAVQDYEAFLSMLITMKANKLGVGYWWQPATMETIPSSL